MTIAEARGIARSAHTLAEEMDVLQTPAKVHGQRLPRVDPIRHAWEAVNQRPLPEVLRRYTYGELL